MSRDKSPGQIIITASSLGRKLWQVCNYVECSYAELVEKTSKI